ncbi:isoleucyl-tRNA synthetase [Candidatus Magnetobacterium bavaricum]|uniref:Isoleucine--tRNA ligase n=1 Tax=Candidatus Magnetobacterium bavaricum TaxID=29290 RepID=A0A0F3GM09_9BACT|nr:isoleucyl-tRNA synthetase [Candidatus Magnetobacterium bavaricum]
MEKDYKDTLNLPQTEFPMKANLVKREPQTLSFWKDNAVYQQMLQKNKDNTTYILHDGPPYANGHIHIGHALNKILKDIIVKYNSMRGRYAPYVPGWDCHGLPIEHQVDKELGSKKAELSVNERRMRCRKYAEKFIDIQREEFVRLGVFGKWDTPYITMSYDYQATIVREFHKFLSKGYVYKGRKPVHWCSSCMTALAEAEVEYNDKQSPSVFVRFKVLAADLPRITKDANVKDVYIVIWTTTPWTLPANMALAVHPDIDYAVVVKGANAYIVARDLVERLNDTTGIGEIIAATLKGSALAGITTAHPFVDRTSAVLTAPFVSAEEGTGVVHIAPGHGEDDYEVGIRHGLDVYAPVDNAGKFTAEVGFLQGKFVLSANEEIIQLLNKNHDLLHREDITHSYPHCWRCKRPVIFRATDQWFISMQRDDLKQRCLDEIERVNWIPAWGIDRINAMVKNRPDWCISRQRSWGVPIAVLNCKGCGKVVTDQTVLTLIADKVQAQSADVWFELPAEAFLPQGYVCGKCGSKEFDKESDILDVWFDSGVSHQAVLQRFEGLSWPADMYLEGSDQHRGWFQSSLITSTGVRDKAPFKTVLTHGFVVDGKGKKMSKSLGNVITPADLINQNGADILRLWVAAEDYRNDIRISKEILDRLTEAYRKIRNTCRFLIGNINDLDNAGYSAHLNELDRWAMHKLQVLIVQVTRAYDSYSFHEVFHCIHNFCIIDMSSFYLDIIKDRVYTFADNSPQRRAAQWTMKKTLTTLTALMAPILSFTAEEVWQHSQDKGHDSIFLVDFPVPDQGFIDDALDQRWQALVKIRDIVNKALEIKRREKVIGNSLEAKVSLFCDEPYLSLMNDYKDFLPTLFIVSQAVHLPYDQIPEATTQQMHRVDNLAIDVVKAEGQKCLRCWNVSVSVGSFSDEPDLCSRCYDVLHPQDVKQ